MKRKTITKEEIAKINKYIKAATYLSVGQIYLMDNPLLDRPLEFSDVKPRLLGHFGTTPGLNFIYAHLNRVIKNYGLNVIFVTGPGHGGPAIIANSYLEGVYSKYYPEITEDKEGMKKLFKQFSFPGGVPSHVSAETPGSINEGGELGYSLSHAYGAVLDNKDLIAACVIGDGEAETGPLAASWHGNKFINPLHDGTVLPILHLNGYKIANPTILSRISKEELESLLVGYGHKPYFVEGENLEDVSYLMAEALDRVVEDIKNIKKNAKKNGNVRPAWPMIVLKTPKGWTGPKEVDGKQVEGSFRSHQVPIAEINTIEHLKELEKWLKSYEPEKLFTKDGKLIPELKELAPDLNHAMSNNKHANGGLLLKELDLPNMEDYMIDNFNPGSIILENTKVMGTYLRDVIVRNKDNFRIFSPDELNSNRWQDVLDVTNRAWMADIYDNDDKISKEGRVIEILSEHQCEGMLEGYLLTGRHGFFSCYEAFIHIVDSMFNQHAKWLSVTNRIPWRKPIASLNYLLSSHVWRQDHNGYSHQEPGFIDHLMSKKPDITRVYLPIDVNTLISTTRHCLKTKQYVNLIVAGKQPNFQWFNKEEAIDHCRNGIGIMKFASTSEEPDVIMACAGDVPTLETLAAVKLLNEYAPNLKIRVINIIDLMKLQSYEDHPHGLNDEEFDQYFTKDKPVIFAFHGYTELIYRLIYKRQNHNFHIHGFNEEGSTTTPFDMTVLNKLDRYHLAIDVLESVDNVPNANEIIEMFNKKLEEHHSYIREHGEDMPEIRNWSWDGTISEIKNSTEDDNK